ncbi:MAG: hypothetical protein DSM106950_23500 [Stigonema ocellatum SAG 48.90 = DSM 106950]|nr:hypothetical protein [Stigonema ocellatum SAG 48.90 = DSM 106950]
MKYTSTNGYVLLSRNTLCGEWGVGSGEWGEEGEWDCFFPPTPLHPHTPTPL